MLASAFFQSTKSELVCKVPALLTSLVIHSTDATGKIALYDGQDIISGRLWGNIASPSGTPFLYSLHFPILFESGIYVLAVATIEDYTINYIPLRGGSPLRASQAFMMDENE